MLCLASSERLYWLREELYSPICITQILSGRSLCGKSCVDNIVEILLCEGGDVELCARTSKHIFVYAFDPLSLTLSYIVPCIIHITHSYLYAWYCCLCAILVLN